MLNLASVSVAVKALLHCAMFSATHARQVSEKRAQCNRRFLAIFSFCVALHEVEFGSTFRNLQRHCTVYHPFFSNFSRNF